MNTVTLKISWKDDTRRIRIPSNTTYQQLHTEVAQKFGLNDFRIKYIDEENELITVSTDRELFEAIDYLRDISGPRAIVRFFVRTPEDAATHATQSMLMSSVLDPSQSASNIMGMGPPYGNTPGISQFAGMSPYQPVPPSQPTHAYGERPNYSPNQNNLPNSNQYGSNSNQYGSNSNQYGSNSNQYGSNSNQYGSNSNQYGAPGSNPSQPEPSYSGGNQQWNENQGNNNMGNMNDLPNTFALQQNNNNQQQFPAHDVPKASPVKKINESKYNSRFVRDKQIRDGEVVQPGAKFTKIWVIRNTGELPWPKGTVLEWQSGDKLQTIPERVEVPEALPQQDVDVAVDIIAPTTEANYTAHYRMVLPNGGYFGNRVWADISVKKM